MLVDPIYDTVNGCDRSISIEFCLLYWPKQTFSQHIEAASHTTQIVCVKKFNSFIKKMQVIDTKKLSTKKNQVIDNFTRFIQKTFHYSFEENKYGVFFFYQKICTLFKRMQFCVCFLKMFCPLKG